MTGRGHITVVGGGARSGKSRFALQLARARGPRRRFIATAEARDAEMRTRIDAHRRERGDAFDTLEEPHDLRNALLGSRGHDVIVIDCATLWLANRVIALDDSQPVLSELRAAVEAIHTLRLRCIVVTNEVGMGIVPDTKLARDFRDLAGTANQYLAEAAHEVFLATMGMVLRLRPGPIEVVTPEHR